MAFIGQAYAQTKTDDRLKESLRLTMPKARVTQVIDGQTLVVNNTTTISLPMLYIPWDSPQEPGEGMKRAKDFLGEELKDRFVRIYQIRDQKRGQENNMGHVQGFIVRDDGVWIQEAMALKGLAFVYPTQDHFEFADDLYKVEAEARDNKTGFWEDPKWAVVSDEEAKTLEDRFAIVEGKVEKVATRNNTIYLNFDRDWRDDFTIAIESFRRRDFAKAGANPMQWSGETVRVRGWIRDYNGPFIEIFHPSQIEVIEEPIVKDAEAETNANMTETESDQSQQGKEEEEDYGLSQTLP